MKMKEVFFNVLWLFCFSSGRSQANSSVGTSDSSATIQFIVCSDLHFGLTKPVFRNHTNVRAAYVNQAMIAQMNVLPSCILPGDGGVGGGRKVGGIEGVFITGDVCNRQETGIQRATDSWKEFAYVFASQLHLSGNEGKPTKLLVTPGNHDISNAIGFHRPMQPLTDNSSLVNMYNLEMHPAIPKSSETFNSAADRIHYSVNIGGIHMMLVSAWPDSAERVWMTDDLDSVPQSTPAFIFTHSDPAPEARFFQNPNGDHSINAIDKFENLVPEKFKTGTDVKDRTETEQRGLVAFLLGHPNIKAYFHGHTNYAEFYDWKGPDGNIILPCFRTDSPMKGRESAQDETKVSFNLVSIDTRKKLMTVRECLWNAKSRNGHHLIAWGISRTIKY